MRNYSKRGRKLEEVKIAEQQDIAYTLARHASSAEYDSIMPRETIEATKNSILDSLGVIAAATSLGGGSRELFELVKENRRQRKEKKQSNSAILL